MHTKSIFITAQGSTLSSYSDDIGRVGLTIFNSYMLDHGPVRIYSRHDLQMQKVYHVSIKIPKFTKID